jgi:hypothetical protein
MDWKTSRSTVLILGENYFKHRRTDGILPSWRLGYCSIDVIFKRDCKQVNHDNSIEVEIIQESDALQEDDTYLYWQKRLLCRRFDL